LTFFFPLILCGLDLQVEVEDDLDFLAAVLWEGLLFLLLMVVMVVVVVVVEVEGKELLTGTGVLEVEQVVTEVEVEAVLEGELVVNSDGASDNESFATFKLLLQVSSLRMSGSLRSPSCFIVGDGGGGGSSETGSSSWDEDVSSASDLTSKGVSEHGSQTSWSFSANTSSSCPCLVSTGLTLEWSLKSSNEGNGG